jgi:hypothetical protein
MCGIFGIVPMAGVSDQLRWPHNRGADRHDMVVVAVKDQRRHVEFLEVFSEIHLGECLDAVEGVLVTGLHSLEPERVDHALRDLGAEPVSPEVILEHTEDPNIEGTHSCESHYLVQNSAPDQTRGRNPFGRSEQDSAGRLLKGPIQASWRDHQR